MIVCEARASARMARMVVPSDRPGGDHVRVLTMNLLAPQHARWSERRAVLVDALRELQPDVAALQEVATSDEYDEVADLFPGFHAAHHSRRSADGVGACLVSRWPLRDVAEVDLHVSPRTESFPWCATLTARVLAPAPFGPLLLAHHKPSWQYGYELEREAQAVLAARHIAERVGVAADAVHVVLLGDFDAAPDSASVRFWTGRQSLHGTSVCYRDTWEHAHPERAGHTFSPRNPLVRAGEMPLERGRRIDYVMVRCGQHGPTLDVTRCATAFDEPVGGIWASDHFGVVTDLVVPARPAGSWA